MPFADASLTAIRDAVESTYGVAPTGTYKSRRFVSETLGQDKEVVQSDEVVSDRRSPDNIQVGSSASGEMVSELTGGGIVPAFNTWDDYWLSALGATGFTSLVGALPGTMFSAGTITPTNEVDADDIKLTVSGGTPTNWPAFSPGELIQIVGFTGVRAVLNTIYKVKSGGGTTGLVLTAGPRVPSTPGTENANVIGAFQLQSITDGTVFRSFSIERAYSLSSEYALLSGMVLTGFTVEIAPKRPMRVTWRWLGKEEVSMTTQTPGTVTGVISRKSFSPVSDFAEISLDENGHDYFLNSFKLDFKNGSYLQDERAGQLGAVGVGFGTFECTGSYEFYYDNAAGSGTAGARHDELQRFVDKELIVAVRNSAGDSWGVILPRINWTAGRRSVVGKDQAVKGTVDFRAARGPAYLLKICRL